MLNVLCIETCLGKCSVALKHNGVEDYAETKERFAQSEQLFVLIKEVLKRNSIGFENLDIMGCTIGPGSFTGIRIGIAAVKGIQKISRTRLLGVSTLEVMVNKIQLPVSESKILAILSASSQDMYVQEFDSYGNISSPIHLLSHEALQEKSRDSFPT